LKFLFFYFFFAKIIFCKNTFKQNSHYFALTNFFLGLARGPIDHQSSSVINVIANEAIEMGSSVRLDTTIPTTELLPRVDESDVTAESLYGIAVGGDTDGIYSTTGAASSDDSTRATSSAGQGVVVVTQGRCLARVDGNTAGPILVGSKLAAIGTTAGVLELALTGEQFIAIALQPSSGVADIIAVDVQRGLVA